MLERMDNRHIRDLITEHSIKEDVREEEFNYYYSWFKDFSKKRGDIQEKGFKENIKIRSKLEINKSLSVIFSPAKLRIMEKIFQHDKLTNTELKYYYRSIRPLMHAILNEDMQQYLRIVDSLKKYH